MSFNIDPDKGITYEGIDFTKPVKPPEQPFESLEDAVIDYYLQLTKGNRQLAADAMLHLATVLALRGERDEEKREITADFYNKLAERILAGDSQSQPRPQPQAQER